ncbi:MAG: PLP-dependent aspartate aminotransferase family protein [Planctomycetes bacterium]|nr:PLP-dependent aspartate aminotransferase family protein [Planctomycetota bacterium]
MSHLENAGFNTKTVHAGCDPSTQLGAVSTPIFQTSTFAFDNADHGAALFAGKEKGYIYTRMGNPTIENLESAVAALEGAKFGLATSTGMAAVVTAYMALLSAGDHMVSTAAVYGPSRTVMERDFRRFGIESSYVDTSNLDEIEKAIRPNTKVLYIETPANPTISITDIAGCVEIAKKHNLVTICDNTFATPMLQKPLELGCDIVLHSMTKFLNGHGDVVAGMLVTKSKELYTRLRSSLLFHGGTMDPHQAWLVHRGLKTLGLRVQRETENAMIIAKWLEQHPKVDWILYPGLESHPQYDIYKKQMTGASAVMSFGVKGGIEEGKKVMNSVELFTLAVSLGGIESLIQHPASMTHASVPKEEREKAGITDSLIRISVGIEDVEDLQADLEHALSQI